MSLVTVLLPNYNNAPYLKECIDSLLNQTFQDFVVFFVDDCSTDNSLEIVEAYQNPKLVVIKKDANSGIVDTLNKGLEKITTKYFIRMDGDDVSHPQRFEKLVQFMEQHPEIGVCSSAIQVFGKSTELWKYPEDPNVNHANLIFGHSVGHASSIFRTEIFQKNSIKYLDRFWRMEDYDLFYRLKAVTRTTSIPEALYLYRQGEYNNNPQIHARKTEAFRQFYAMVQDDLGVESTTTYISLHMQLARKEQPTFSFAEFRDYCSKLITANQKFNLFPHKELSDRLNRALNQIMHRLIDKAQIGFMQVVRFANLNVFRYYVSSLFQKRRRSESSSVSNNQEVR